MDHHKLHVSINTPEKPSKILALFALIFAFTLPFILVKTFPHKQKTKLADKSLSLPQDNSTRPNHDNTTVSSSTNASEVKPQLKLTQALNNKPLQKSGEKPGNINQANFKKTIKMRPGDTLTSLFIRLGLNTRILQQVIHDSPQAKLLTKIQAGQEIKFLIKNRQLIKMTLPFSSTQYIVLYRDQDLYKLKVHSHKTTQLRHFLTATVHGSLYNTAKRNNISSQLIQQMTEILAWDINFSKDIQDGDKFTIVYNSLFIKDKQVGIGDILAVSYRNNGHTFQAIRHTNRAGQSDYYAPNGGSLKKAFNRYPLQFSHISSTFSLSRYHPILHYSRPHKGVDLAARIGTPIHATADGRIEIIGRQGAYGNMIKIKHNKTYSTIYGHLLKFQKGLSRGSYVRLGQVIGYVGQSGLADGPHCHYEFHINNQPKNPSTVKLPRGEPLTGRELLAFKANSNTLLAQMKGFEGGRQIVGKQLTPNNMHKAVKSMNKKILAKK